MTSKSRPRSSSTSSACAFDSHHPSNPSQIPPPLYTTVVIPPSPRSSNYSQDSWGSKTREVRFHDEHKAERGRTPEAIPEREQEQAQNFELPESESQQEQTPELESEPVEVPPSSTVAKSGDSDEPLTLQLPEPSANEATIIVSTALSPVEEMPSSAATEVPSVPTPTAASAEVGDTQPDAGLAPPSESTLIDTTVYVEQEVPDPFLIDDEGDAMSEDEREEHERERETSVAPSAASSEPPAAQEVALSVSTTTLNTAAMTSPSPSEPPILSPLNVNKDVPPPPEEEQEQDAEEGTQEEEEVPDLFLPGLIIPTMFLPIPNVRRSLYSPNMLLWWLPKSTSMYHMCNRQIH